MQAGPSILHALILHDSRRSQTRPSEGFSKRGVLSGKEGAWAGTDWTDITCCSQVGVGMLLALPTELAFISCSPHTSVAQAALHYSQPLSLSLSLTAPSLCFPPSSPHEMMLLMLLIWELQTQGCLRLSVEVACVGGLRECPAEARQRAVVITRHSSRRVPSSPGLGRKLTACVLSL